MKSKFKVILLIMLFVNFVGCTGLGSYSDEYKTSKGFKKSSGYTFSPRPETAKDIAEADAITARTHYMMSQQKAGNNLMYGVVENHKSAENENESSTVRFYFKTEYDSDVDKARVVWSSTIPPGQTEFIYLPAGDYVVCVEGCCDEFSIDNIPFDEYYDGFHYDFYFNTKNY